MGWKLFSRQRQLLEETAINILQEEALAQAFAVCQVLPAGQGENMGDLASLSVALNLVSD